MVGVWFPFFCVCLHLFCAHDRFTCLSSNRYQLLLVFGIEKQYFGGIRCLDVSPRSPGYWSSYDISTYRILWYRMIWNMGYFAIYHAVPHRITPKKQANSPATSLLSTVVVWALCLCHLHDLSFFRPAFFVVLLLSIVWTHHRTDRNTSKQNPATLSPEGQACSLSAWMFFFHLFAFFFLYVFPSPYFLPHWYS